MEAVYYHKNPEAVSDIDVLVAGGGLAGTMAAVAAARCGMKAVIIEKYGCLGGMATSGLVNPFCQYTESNSGRLANAGLFAEMLEKLYAIGGCTSARPRHFEEEKLKLVLDRMTGEAGVCVLFHSLLTGVETEGGRIKYVTASSVSGNTRLYAKTYIDATGNADLTAFAGLGYHKGREEDGLCQAMTLFCRFGNVDWKKFNVSDARAAWQAEKKTRNFRNPCDKLLIFRLPLEGVAHFNATRILNTDPLDVYAMSNAEREGREQVYELLEFMRERVSGMENAQLLQTAVEVGVRESRRIIGHYQLTADDILGTRKFPDSIARGVYCVDIHNPRGGNIIVKRIPDNDYYTIPYRSLVPVGIDNLIVAGRPISATHEAHAAIRIMPITTCIGEATGEAAAIAVEKGLRMIDVPVPELQEKLKNHGALI